MDNEIKYNVKTIINTDNKNKEELVKIFNQKLLKLILLFENKT